ncbi:MAG: nucleotidyltransferase family protein, partial [Clostridia bacterium]|nr:nucleotidyltransferase family protein [Clostridia bacterium]
MKTSAIICEYNPFHNGHKFQIDTARSITNCDAVIALMSGNFV